MNSKRYTDEFKNEAVKQVTEWGYSASDVARRLGVSSHSLYAWLREAGVNRESRKVEKRTGLEVENARLRAELRRVEEERDILKKAAAYFANTGPRKNDEGIDANICARRDIFDTAKWQRRTGDTTWKLI